MCWRPPNSDPACSSRSDHGSAHLMGPPMLVRVGLEVPPTAVFDRTPAHRGSRATGDVGQFSVSIRAVGRAISDERQHAF